MATINQPDNITEAAFKLMLEHEKVGKNAEDALYKLKEIHYDVSVIKLDSLGDKVDKNEVREKLEELVKRLTKALSRKNGFKKALLPKLIEFSLGGNMPAETEGKKRAPGNVERSFVREKVTTYSR